MDFQRPENLRRAKYHLARPLLYPLVPRCFSIGLHSLQKQSQCSEGESTWYIKQKSQHCSKRCTHHCGTSNFVSDATKHYIFHLQQPLLHGSFGLRCRDVLDQLDSLPLTAVHGLHENFECEFGEVSSAMAVCKS